MKKVFFGLLSAVSLAACGGTGGQPALNQGEAVSIVPVAEAVHDGCRGWRENLSTCQPYRCVYSRGSQLLGKEVLGLKEGKCAYREQVSGQKVLDCALAPSKVQDMADYYDMAEMKENVQLIAMQLADGTVVFEELIDGQPVRTPLQKALSSGTCQLKTVQPANGGVNLLELQFGQGKDTETIVL